MNEESFLEKRKADWLKLMELCDRADRSPTDLTQVQLLELFRLYRRLSTDLALARTISTSPGLITYLNDLTARAYSVVYRQPRQPLGEIIVNAIAIAAQTVRRRKYFIFTSLGIFFGSSILAFLLCQYSPSVHDILIPKEMAPVFAEWKTGALPARTGSQSTEMWGLYASNNPRVAVITGAVGAGSFGIISFFMILKNGFIMGSLASELVPVNHVGFFLSSIFPHGVPEITGLILSGSAGLLLGWSLINPGIYTRGESLRRSGKDAITLLATSVVMMFIAAPIEGFFSFNPVFPQFLKVIVGAVSLTLWLLFWTGFAKEKDPQPEPA